MSIEESRSVTRAHLAAAKIHREETLRLIDERVRSNKRWDRIHAVLFTILLVAVSLPYLALGYAFVRGL